MVRPLAKPMYDLLQTFAGFYWAYMFLFCFQTCDNARKQESSIERHSSVQEYD
jgi:hypothetical protein